MSDATVQVITSWVYPVAGSFHTLIVNEGGGDVSLTLTAAADLEDALQAWEDLANAHGSLAHTYAFGIDTTGTSVGLNASGSFAATLSTDLAAWLGFSSGALGSASLHISDVQPHGVLAASCGYSVPWPIEAAELAEFRLGRSAAYVHSHALECEVWWTCTRAQWDVVGLGPMNGGKVRVWHNPAGTGHYQHDNLTGYIDIEPFDVPRVEFAGREEQLVRVRLRGTVAEPVAGTRSAAPLPDATTWAGLSARMPYGWGQTYLVTIEGIPHAFIERDIGSSDPTGYELLPCLVVDGSAAVGSQIDRRKGAGRAFAFTCTLLDQPSTWLSDTDAATVRGLFKTPSAWATIDEDLDWDFTHSLDLKQASGAWGASGSAYLGTETVDYASKTGTPPTVLTTLTRGQPEGDWKAYDHKTRSLIGTIIANSPQIWLGREVRLHVLPVTPFGGCPLSDVVQDSLIIWRGTIASEPRRFDGRWAFDCQPLDRLLSKPAVRAISGEAHLGLSDDRSVEIDGDWTLNVEIATIVASTGVTTIDTISMAPFDGSGDVTGDMVSVSRIRSLIKKAWQNAILAATLTAGQMNWSTDSVWKPETQEDGAAFWRWYVKATPDNVGDYALARISSTGTSPDAFRGATLSNAGFPLIDAVLNDTVTPAQLWTALTTDGTIDAVGSFSVTIDDGDTSLIPETGVVIVEGEDESSLYEYDRITRTTDSPIVQVHLANPSGKIRELDTPGDDPPEASATFAFVDAGLLPDVMRRLILSSGRGDNDATYDVNDLAYGLDIAHTDTASFGTALGSVSWKTMSASLVVSEESSFVDLFGGVLALSQHAVAMTGEESGDPQITAVATGPAHSGLYQVKIEDRHLVTDASGGDPVRVLNDARPHPNRVTVEIKRAEQEDAKIHVSDLQSMRATGTEEWSVDIHGLTRSSLIGKVFAWAESLFATGPGKVQIVEVDTSPALAKTGGRGVQLGDIVKLDLTHHALWQYSTGTQGYNGFGRVIGRRTDLSTGVVTLTLLIAGAWDSFALSPSAPISAWAGTADAPTSIDVPRAYFDLFTQWYDDDGAFELNAYIPGADTTGQRYTISAVVDTGSVCRLTVSAQTGVFTITSAWYVTAPSVALGTASTNDHAHTTSAGWWL